MNDALQASWRTLPAVAQDLLLLGGWLAPVVIGLVVSLRRYRTAALLRAMLQRHAGVALTFVALIAVATGIGFALSVQERGLRAGTAGAADRFDLLITAPGNDTAALLGAVYLQAADLPLLPGSLYRRISQHPAVAMAAPLAFGDSVAGAPLVGTTRDFVQHLIGADAAGTIEGRLFATAFEAVAGADVALSIGSRVQPSHGVGDAMDGVHGHVDIELVGRLPRTGSPWDRAVIVPVEAVWMTHGLGDGHARRPDSNRRDTSGTSAAIGPPFDAARMPGVPAVVVSATSLGGHYTLRERFTDAQSMAFFPGEVLARLYRVLGDARRIMTLLASITQVLVVIAIGVALTILLRSFSRRFAMLRALGAPRRFVFALVWSYAATLLLAGAVLGVGVGMLAAFALAAHIGALSGVHVPPVPSLSDLVTPAVLIGVSALLAVLPAGWLARRSVMAELRA